MRPWLCTLVVGALAACTGDSTPARMVDAGQDAARRDAGTDAGRAIDAGFDSSWWPPFRDAGPCVEEGVLDPPQPITRIYAGHSKSVAVMDDGSVYMWGGHPWWTPAAIVDCLTAPRDMELRTVGCVVDEARALLCRAPGTDWGECLAVLPTRAPVREIAGGMLTTACALLEDGRIACWGSDRIGQLGDGPPIMNSDVPVLVRHVERAISIGMGDTFACAVLEDGHAWCWGDNYHGYLGRGTTSHYEEAAPARIDNVQTTAGGSRENCALRGDGTVWCWGIVGGSLELFPVPIAGATDVIALGHGEHHACVLRSDGTVACWGSNTDAALGAPLSIASSDEARTVEGITDAAQLAVTERHNCVLLRDGRVACWGLNNGSQLGSRCVTTRCTTEGGGDYSCSPTPVIVTWPAG